MLPTIRITYIKVLLILLALLAKAVCFAQPPTKLGAPSILLPTPQAGQQIILSAAQNIFINILKDEIGRKNTVLNTPVYATNDPKVEHLDTTQLLEKIQKKANTRIYKNAEVVIELSSLSADKFVTHNNISWSTNNESYVGGYIIERSSDDVNFKAIGASKASNGSSIQTYIFSDYLIKNAPAYTYRVRVIGANGQSQYSSPTQYTKGQSFVGIAMPSDTTLNRTFFISSSVILTKLQVLNTEGKTLLNTKKINILSPLDFTKYPQGSYTLKLYSQTGAMTQLFFTLN